MSRLFDAWPPFTFACQSLVTSVTPGVLGWVTSPCHCVRATIAPVSNSWDTWRQVRGIALLINGNPLIYECLHFLLPFLVQRSIFACRIHPPDWKNCPDWLPWEQPAHFGSFGGRICQLVGFSQNQVSQKPERGFSWSHLINFLSLFTVDGPCKLPKSH